jgi:MbtH protein
MTDENQNSEQSYQVVLNHEEQYSIWPDDKSLPAGWREGGRRGTRDECLAYIREVWTDMRPLSLRRQMDGV